MHLHIVSREQAKSSGLKRYFWGTPCKHGALAERRIYDKACTCATCDSDRVSARKVYNAANKGKNAERWARYSVENRDVIAAREKAYRAANPEKVAATKRKAKAKSRDATAAYMRSYRIANGDRLRAQMLQYQRGNPHICFAILERRRAAKIQRTPAWLGEFDQFVFEECILLRRARALSTGLKWHTDHMIPLQAAEASGLHCGLNLQVIPSALNIRKSNRLWLTEPDEWLAWL